MQRRGIMSFGVFKRKKKIKTTPNTRFWGQSQLTRWFWFRKNSGVFLHTSLGLSSNSPPWITQAKLISTPTQTSLQRSLPAARAGLIYPCLEPVPKIITSPRNPDRFCVQQWACSGLCWFWLSLFHAGTLSCPPHCFDGLFLHLLFLFCVLSLVCTIIRKLFLDFIKGGWYLPHKGSLQWKPLDSCFLSQETRDAAFHKILWVLPFI